MALRIHRGRIKFEEKIKFSSYQRLHVIRSTIHMFADLYQHFELTSLSFAHTLFPLQGSLSNRLDTLKLLKFFIGMCPRFKMRFAMLFSRVYE